MGFKRTSEGRIFFQSPEDGANDQQQERLKKPAPSQKKPAQKALPTMGTKSPPQTQMQIVTLLKTLNERLKVTQAERDRMSRELEVTRGMIEDLQGKAQANEQAYRALQKKMGSNSGNGVADSSHAEVLARDALAELEETRKLLLDLETKANRADKGVSALKKLQLEQAEKMAVSVNHAAALTKRVKDSETRQEQIGAKVEDALGQQARLSRKIDKAIEERTRFMRKLERIEETVLQTRDSLNAKAMVLLTDQGVAAQKGYSEQDLQHLAPEDIQALKAREVSDKSKQAQTLQAIGAGLLIIAALLGGWLISELQKPDAPSYVETASIEKTTAATASGQSEMPRVDMAEMEWGIETDTSAFNEQGRMQTGAPQTQALTGDDIGTLNLNNQEEVEALLSEKPDAVAAVLNEIEPGSDALPDNIIVSEAPPAVQDSVKPAPEKTQKAPQAAPVKQQAKLPAPSDPAKSMKPDGSLPDVIKKIEEQAFDGVPEAQHDLAAIYTAGHGGVKQDYDRAAFWFEQAASRGVANAAYNLGVLNHQGLGMKADLDKAITWYGHAAHLGHPEAQYNLGIAYIEGIGVPYDAEKAATYFQNAAENNIMEAAYNLGLIYENGLLGEAAPDKALFWYKQAADAGSPEASQALEQLAKSLNVSRDEVNALAESVESKQAANIQPAAGAPAGSVVSNQQVVTAQVQEYLMRMGLYPGPADGITGPLTQDAIRSYQRLHNINPDGQANQALLTHMLSNAIGESTVEQGSRAN